MYNVNLHSFNSSFYKQFYSPTKNQITQYQKNFISHYQGQNRMNNNSFFSNAQSPYIFPIPKNRINNFLQRSPSPPPYSRLIFNYKDNYTKLVYNQSPQNINRLSGNMINQFSPMHLLPRKASPDQLNATTNNNVVYPLLQNPITSININNKIHRYAKTPEPKRNELNNSLNMSNSNPNNISGAQSNLSNMNNSNGVKNIVHIYAHSNNLPISQGIQNNNNNYMNGNNMNVLNLKKIPQNLSRNSTDLENNNNINYQMPNINNNLNDISQNKNFQKISVDKNSSISNNINSTDNNIHTINPNISQKQNKLNSSGKNNIVVNYNLNQNFSPNHSSNQNDYNSSGKNNIVVNYNPNQNFSPNHSSNQNDYNFSGKNNPSKNYILNPNNSSQNFNNDNHNSSGKSNPAVLYDPNQNNSSQNIDPNLNNFPAKNINNIQVIYPKKPNNFDQNHINIIPIRKPIFPIYREPRPVNQIVITKPVPNDNFNPMEFHIISQIGEGSFGKIYCVQWIKNYEKYAMKKLNLFGQEELIILQHKVKIVQNLQKKTGHNGFTTIYGDKCIPAPRPNEYHYYIIMELVEKDWEVELKRRRMNSEFYTEYELLDIVKQLVKTLSIMQQNNVTHRDIKPQNVLIKGGFYKLCDFDEVKIIYNPQPCMHSVRGSELYMAPILFYAYQNKTPSIVHNTYKSDVFSLGMCILLAAGLTAKTLCDIREIKDMNIISEIIISRLFNRYSPNFIKLIIKMLQLEETLRFDFIELEDYILQIWPN